MSTATFGTARHPFRASLPVRVLHRLPQYEPEVAARMAARDSARPDAADDGGARQRFFSLQDLKDFLLAYTACFMATLAWIS